MAFSMWFFASPVKAVELLASIKPLALIANELALESDRVDYMLPAGVSPHAYALSVSQMRRLHSADLILWVGPELESFLQKPVRARSAGHVLTLADLTGLHWPEESAAEAQHHDDHHDHAHEHDLHLWLNPQNTLRVVDALAQRLAILNPAGAAAYAERADEFKGRLRALDAELEVQMRAISARGFAVYHDGYGHWVARYGLNQVDYVTVTPDQAPGAKHLAQLQKHLRQEASCLFVEPYSDVSGAKRMAQNLGLSVAELDPLASAADLNSYELLLRHLANRFSACLLGQL
ncbi:metal ABC transporter solute-binding protein, Zn/Mn family [Gilvimarinus sp. 1_MG-2023]|uniref:metal ABC transporter solute-binding protein, Zn/Mn family n=1 Tax=Gilvimarinus sp. 1_MG-2023 TaxID=3062638 RepID=UPI0026E25964|nr:zinc ABC transporter substrate-binding protein [Gilvimarinus sp. 1_MG-2023]MDO6747606.1 zinc ABC transporter substrate-binding protein [Gilvimarinus sp. 1_MG-2023]